MDRRSNGMASALAALAAAVAGAAKGLTNSQLRASPVVTQIDSAASTSGVINSASGAGSTVTLVLPEGASATGIQLTNGTFVGTTVFEASNDGGLNWSARQYRTSGILNRIESTVVNGAPANWRGNVGGLTHVRVRCTAYTSGTLTVSINADSGVGGIFQLTPAPIGGISTANAINTTVGAGATVTGMYEQMTHVAAINLAVMSVQNGTLTTQYSNDGVTTVQSTDYPVTAGQSFNRIIPPRGEWFRVNFTNTSPSPSAVILEVAYRNGAVQTPIITAGDDAPTTTLAAVSRTILQGINSWLPTVFNVTGTAQRVDSGLAGRKSVLVRARNFATNSDKIYIGKDATVSASNGIELKERESVTMDLTSSGQVWAVGTHAAGNPLEVVEMYDV